jgi:hypothetical protein
MSFTIEQKIGHYTYLYEVESYWDPEKKKPRQRRKYLGKKDPESGQVIRPRTQARPRLCKDYGHGYLLQTIADQLGLTTILKQIFPKDYQILLALAFFEVSEAHSPLPICVLEGIYGSKRDAGAAVQGSECIHSKGGVYGAGTAGLC